MPAIDNQWFFVYYQQTNEKKKKISQIQERAEPSTNDSSLRYMWREITKHCGSTCEPNGIQIRFELQGTYFIDLKGVCCVYFCFQRQSLRICALNVLYIPW